MTLCHKTCKIAQSSFSVKIFKKCEVSPTQKWQKQNKFQKSNPLSQKTSYYQKLPIQLTQNEVFPITSCSAIQYSGQH